MIIIRTLAIIVTISSLSPAVALAQMDRTGTGGGPLSTEKVPNTTAVGQTKPPNRAASPTSHESLEQRSADDRKLDDVEKVICPNCRAK